MQIDTHVQCVIKFLRSLNEGHLRFLDSEKVEITEKTDAHSPTSSISNGNLIQASFFCFRHKV